MFSFQFLQKVLDNDEVLLETEGKKYTTLSSQLFFKDKFPGSNAKKSSRRKLHLLCVKCRMPQHTIGSI